MQQFLSYIIFKKTSIMNNISKTTTIKYNILWHFAMHIFHKHALTNILYFITFLWHFVMHIFSWAISHCHVLWHVYDIFMSFCDEYVFITDLLHILLYFLIMKMTKMSSFFFTHTVTFQTFCNISWRTFLYNRFVHIIMFCDEHFDITIFLHM